MPGSPTSITSRPLPDSVSSNSALSASSSCRAPDEAPERTGLGHGRGSGRGHRGRGRGHLDLQPPQLRDNRGRVGRTRRGILLEQREHERLDRWQHRGVVPRGRHRRGVEVLGDDGDRVVAEERRAPGEHLVERRPERVEIAALVGRAPDRLLGREIRDRADDHALRGEARPVGLDREPEVAEARGAVGREPHVGGLEVTVHHAALVRVLERERDLLADPQRVAAPGAGGRRRRRCSSATEPPGMSWETM